MKRRNGYNPKRQIAPLDEATRKTCSEILDRVIYTGNSEHKMHPNDYGLMPPTNPRPGKTLCDAERVFPKAEAVALLRNGVNYCMISIQRRNGWPQNIWAVHASNEVFEAQLENSAQGTYHGYPMPVDDDFQATVVKEWERRKHGAGN